jgi:apolipoprotein N-acyltransferase
MNDLKALGETAAKRPFLSGSLAGIFLGVGFIVPFLWWVSFLGIALLFHLTLSTRTLLGAVCAGFAAFVVKSLLALWWLWSTYPLGWLGADLSGIALPLIFFYWFSAAVWLGLGGAAFGAAVFHFRSFSRYWLVILLPATLVVAETIGSLSFSLFTLGPGGSLNASFSFGQIGYLLGEHAALLALATLGGVYALSFTAGVGGAFLWLAFTRLSTCRAAAYTAAALALLIVSSVLVKAPPYQPILGLSVAVVETDFRGETRQAPAQGVALREALAAALRAAPDYVILPEDSRLTPLGVPYAEAHLWYGETLAHYGTMLIDSGRVDGVGVEGSAALRAFIVDGREGSSFAADKQYLVPQGEYMPILYEAALRWLFRADTSIEAMRNHLAYRPGPLKSQASLPPHAPGVLFCFESVSPLGVFTLKRERAMPFVAHPISHAWFHRSKILWRQLDLMLKAQARFNDISIVSAGNEAPSAHYTPQGGLERPRYIAAGDNWRVGLIDL